jgi:hypothetical protein
LLSNLNCTVIKGNSKYQPKANTDTEQKITKLNINYEDKNSNTIEIENDNKKLINNKSSISL